MSTKCYHVCVMEKHHKKATRKCFHTVGPSAVELSKCVKEFCLYKKVNVYKYIYICSTCMCTKNNKVPHTHTMYHIYIYHLFLSTSFFALPQTSKTMGHWSVEDFVKEVHDVNQYIQERPQAVMLASSLVSGLVEKIKLTNMWTCGNLLEVTKAVKSTQLEDQHKNTLLKALDDKTMDQQKRAVKVTMVPQSLTQIHNYLSGTEWMNAQQSSMAALQAISTRLRLCGVKALKEDTKKWCTALMVHFEMERAAGERPAYTTVYRMSQEMHTAFQCSQVEAKAEPLVQYPVSPLDLGEAWLSQVYDPKDMPTNRDVPNLLILVKNHIPIRNTSALLTKEKNQLVPSSGSNEPMDKMMGIWQQLGSCLLQGHLPNAQPSPNTGELLLHSFQPRKVQRLEQNQCWRPTCPGSTTGCPASNTVGFASTTS